MRSIWIAWTFGIALLDCRIDGAEDRLIELIIPETHAAHSNLNITIKTPSIIDQSGWRLSINRLLPEASNNNTDHLESIVCTFKIDSPFQQPAIDSIDNSTTIIDSFQIPCHCFDHAGMHIVRVVDRNSTVLVERQISIRWPTIDLKMIIDDTPRLSISSIDFDGSKCDHGPLGSSNGLLDLRANRSVDEISGGSADQNLEQSRDQVIDRSANRFRTLALANRSIVITLRRQDLDSSTGDFSEITVPVADWYRLINRTIDLPCTFFLKSGIYDARLIADDRYRSNVPSIIDSSAIDQSIASDPTETDQDQMEPPEPTSSISDQQSPSDAITDHLISLKTIISISPPTTHHSPDPLEGFELKVIGHFVYPCPSDKGLPVTYRRTPPPGSKPSCSSVHKYEAIRLEAAQSSNDPSTIDQQNTRADQVYTRPNYIYVSEEKLLRASDGSGVAYFGCNHFDLIYPEYCFRLVTVYADGTVVERARTCLPTQSTKYAPVPGQWSAWREWGPCTISCGSSSVQHRIRYCDHPRPKDGGQFCPGPGLETRACVVDPCPAPPSSITPSPSLATSAEDRCACGCNLTRPEGGLVAIDTRRCPRETNLWYIVAPSTDGIIIELTMLRLEFRRPEHDWLRIRNADSGILIFDSSTGDMDGFDRSVLIDSDRSLSGDSDRSRAINRDRSKSTNSVYRFGPIDGSKQSMIRRSIDPISTIDPLDRSIVRSQTQGLLVEHHAVKIPTDHSSSPIKIADSDRYPILIRYRFLASSISKHPLDTRHPLIAWWNRLSSNPRYLSIFAASSSIVLFVILASIFVLAARYTLRKLRSKCNYLMLMSQTTQSTASPGQHQSINIGGGQSPRIAHQSSTEIVSIRRSDRGEHIAREPLLGQSIASGDRGPISIIRRSSSKKNLARIPEEIMQTSMNTETTRLSGTTQSPSPASPPRNRVEQSDHDHDRSFDRPVAKSTPKSVRSIGIQLSSPALSSMRRHISTDRCRTNGGAPPPSHPSLITTDRSSSSITTTNDPNHRSDRSATSQHPNQRPESPNLSIAGTEHEDLEFDYYDAPVPGSIFEYASTNWRTSFFETDIDIDDIIDQSDLMCPSTNNNNSSSSAGSSSRATTNGRESPTTMISVSTQSQQVQTGGNNLASGESAESSEWSFKWSTKPNTATTQFHFL